MSIIQYPISTNATTTYTDTFTVKVYSLVTTASPTALDLIFQTNTPVLFGFATGSYTGPTTLTLASFVQETNNKAAVTDFNFSFTVNCKGMYVTNRVRINLGQYFTDNSASQISPRCKIYEYSTAGSTEYSHDWAGVDTSQRLSML